MREAFEVMGNHALLTLFLGFLFIVAVSSLTDIALALVSRIPKRKNKQKDDSLK